MEFSHPPPSEMHHPAGPPPSNNTAGGGGGDDFSMPPPSAGGAPNEADSTNNGGGGDGAGGGGGESGGGGGGFRRGDGGGFRGGYRGHYRGGFHHNNHHGGGGGFHGGHRHHDGPGGRGGGAGTPGQPFFRSFGNFGRGPSGMPMTQDDFDGKRLRKSVMRKTVDYNAAIIRALENRVWQRDFRDRRALQPESIYAPEMLPPPSYMDNPTNAVTTRFVKTATNKMRCPIFTLAWTPEGRRLVTGASSGEFTLWNGLTFNFETILQAHDCPVRTMVWSHNDNWMVTGDHQGNVKYWQSNMNNVRAFQAHKDPVRGISFSPSDNKFVSCSDDGTLRVFDFLRCQEENVLRGHGADVKCVHWHPQKSLIVSGSKDNQQPIKLWDPKSGQSLATLHAHKSTVMDLKWNNNGNWLITASRDHLLKLFDLRNLKEEVQVFRGHKKEASAVSWHPVHEGLFSSGGSDGSILFWNVGTDKEVGAIEGAHDSIVWTLAWHPLGHILCSGSNDHTIKFWTRNRPGDAMRDKYNLNTLPVGLQGMEDGMEIDDNHIIPGMGPEDKIDFPEANQPSSLSDDRGGNIPGLDLDTSSYSKDRGGGDRDKKVPYSKPIPRNFQAQWNDNGRPDEEEFGGEAEGQDGGGKIGGMPFDGLPDMSVQPPNMSCAPPPIQQPSAIIVYGITVIVKPGSRLAEVISEGPGSLNRFISAREIPELNDQLPPEPQFDESNSSKRPCIDHNAQLIFDQNSGSIGFIPPLMALNPVAGSDGQPLNVSQPPPDFMMPMNGGAGGPGGPGGPGGVPASGNMDMWSGPPPGGQWRVPPNGGGGGGHMGGDPGQWMPPNNGPNGGDDEFQNRGGGGRRDGRVSRFDNGNNNNNNNNNGGMGGGNQRGFGGNYNRGGFGGGRGNFGGGNGRFGNGGGGGDDSMGYNMNHMGGGGPGPQDNMQFNNNGNNNGGGGGGDFGNRMMNNNRGNPNNRPPPRRY